MNKKPLKQHRKRKIEVLFNEEELVFLEEKMTAEGAPSKSKYLRNCGLNRKAQRVQNYAPFVAQLGYIGNNINQVAAALNYIKKSGDIGGFDFSLIERHLSACADYVAELKEKKK